MDTEGKIFYNEASAEKLGWDSTWFGVDDFDESLIDAILEFQKIYEDLDNDGLCGASTFRRIYTVREAQMESLKDRWEDKEECVQKYIICNGENVEIEWDKVITMHDKGNLRLDKGYKHISEKREVKQFVVHWDAALSAESCRDILKRRGLSVQFMIDNDGTIYQAVDCNHVCWHAPPCNFSGIGVEISNAVYLKYQKHYERKGFGSRPILPKQKIHNGTYGPLLGFYPVQIEALKALTKAVCGHYGIPLRVPENKDGEMLHTVHKKTDKDLSEWEGVCAHYHLSKKKFDVIGTDLKDLVESLR